MTATRKAANISASAWSIPLNRLDGIWNLRAREIAMAMLNPQHPALLDRGVHLGRRAAAVSTLGQQTHRLCQLAAWAAEHRMPDDLSLWQPDDARAFVDDMRTGRGGSSIMSYVGLVRRLHQLSRALTGGGLSADPWPGQTAREVADNPKDPELRTKNIAPPVWFAIIRAAWAYVHDFAPDILRARDQYRTLMENSSRSTTGARERLNTYLADQDNLIPLHPTSHGGGRTPAGRVAEGTVNWSLLRLLSGTSPKAAALYLNAKRDPDNRARVMAVAASTPERCVLGGLGGRLRQIERQDESTGPWHRGLAPRTLGREITTLRDACYILVIGLSMMRDSEVREIHRNALVEYYGAPALVSRKRKLDPDAPTERWWIIEPVAEAIAVAESLSWDDELIFATHCGSGAILSETCGDSFDSGNSVNNFINHVNENSGWNGLRIPPGGAAPHRFRKTMAMLVGEHPGAEIALGMQLKHVATRALSNQVTGGYMADDADWAKLLNTAVEDAHFERLNDFYADFQAGKPVGFGPGAEKITAEFTAIQETAERLRSTAQPRHGDARVEFDLLRKSKMSIRFGTLNHCAFDPRNPAGAVCLENAAPGTMTEPQPDRCRPDRCANSVIAPVHLPIWSAERESLNKQLQSPKLAPCHRDALKQQLAEVEATIEKGQQS
ncbi:hypothetical protein OG453_23610 [Streptomyces sp. NBC_01381]|uniref:hypothetical protein n=1 Tax=Streptomyces sp. NBC_01381 TaxID=2903845 RepID=UPI00224F1DD0|nr:hypothetical protein [Streptomyces sp. NBC_01381]MCX4669634.1 hypothetical protein [Streptomyces sp. NBC_01381]